MARDTQAPPANLPPPPPGTPTTGTNNATTTANPGRPAA